MKTLKSKILIVDDHKENILALSKLIESNDYEIYTALNAQEALEILTYHDFSLALLDVQMPEIDGFELARLIRGVKRHKNLPIIFVTAQQQDQFVLFEGYEAGAVDLLFKPLVPTIVRSKVRVFVELDKQKRLLESQVQELDQLRRQADAANVAKSQFLANMSHEIRTPLAAVMSFAEMIASDKFAEDERDEMINMIKKNGDLLLRLIDDILDIARIETSKVDIDQAPLAFVPLLNDVKTTLTPKAEEKGIGLKFQISSSCDTNYQSDPTRIKQVLLNIIGNAIKFTSQGDVVVQIDAKPDDASGTRDIVRILVQDAGIGISPDHQVKLFAAFTQADTSTRRQFGGSGLGLMISKSLAQAMGGDVRLVRSGPEFGSLFEITFRLVRTQQDVSSTGTATPTSGATNSGPDFSGKKILIVDDYPENLVILQLYLRPTKADLTLVQSGTEALQVIQDNKLAFDIVLMDIQMPKMDGHTTTRAIRAFDKETPIIAVTAHASVPEREKCLHSGCNAVLTKPLNREKLLRSLSDHLLGGATAELIN